MSTLLTIQRIIADQTGLPIHELEPTRPLEAAFEGRVKVSVSGLKRFLLFTAPLDGKRKDYALSFDSREGAIAAAEKIKAQIPVCWQVMDNYTAEIVAEDPGLSP